MNEKEKLEWQKENEERRKNNENYFEVLSLAKKEQKQEHTAPTDCFLSCQHINKIYSNRVQAVTDFSLDVKDGEFIVLVGPSGCGKSTTLRMIAGLEDITSGDLYIDGKYANKLEPKERHVAMVFQSYALYPHMSVYENMAFGLKGSKEAVEVDGHIEMRRLTREEIDGRIQAAAKALQITEYLNRKPTQLSGGQCQRVALGRAYVRNAKVFLLDEPLSNLDAKLRIQMRSELVRLHDDLKNTMIYVTHDQTEAMTMADRIVILKLGKIQQIGTPIEVYDHPANLFVATFIGSPTTNVIETIYRNGKISIGDLQITLSPEQKEKIEAFYPAEIEAHKAHLAKLEAEPRYKDKKQTKLAKSYQKELVREKELIQAFETLNGKEEKPILFGIRPENLSSISDSKRLSDPLKVKIETAELLGADYYLHFSLKEKDWCAKVPADRLYHIGDEVVLKMDLEKIHLFDTITEKSIF